MKQEVEKILNELRPSLEADGGNVELVEVDEKKGEVKVRLQGACQHCPMSSITLEQGIARALKEKVPGVKSVIRVD